MNIRRHLKIYLREYYFIKFNKNIIIHDYKTVNNLEIMNDHETANDQHIFKSIKDDVQNVFLVPWTFQAERCKYVYIEKQCYLQTMNG